MVVAQGEIWWADLGPATGSAPAVRRPVLIVQSDALNRSNLATVICVPLTSNLRWGEAPGNVLLRAEATGLPKDSVANVSEVITLDKNSLETRLSKIPRQKLDLVLSGIEVVLGR